MPIIFHLSLMIPTMLVVFVAGGYYGIVHRDALLKAGLPEWSLIAIPLLGLYGSLILFHLIPVRCPNCRLPLASARWLQNLIYRCWKCGHVHHTPVRVGKRRTHPEDVRRRFSSTRYSYGKLLHRIGLFHL